MINKNGNFNIPPGTLVKIDTESGGLVPCEVGDSPMALGYALQSRYYGEIKVSMPNFPGAVHAIHDGYVVYDNSESLKVFKELGD